MGVSIPGYEITREIHRGGQGVVFQAIQVSTKRKVAVKILVDGAYASAEAQRRLQREVEIVAGLRHPNIVTAYDSGKSDDGTPYFVMDYVSGVQLDEFVRTKSPPRERLLALFADICDGVMHAHLRGIIHRDLKPSNVLVDGDGVPRVLDFGLARAIDDRDRSLVSASGQVAGTLPYLSPEQARGETHAVDLRTDVYALGVMLYEILTGRYPYDVDGDFQTTITNIIEAAPAPMNAGHVSGAPHSASRANSRIDGELETIVLKALAKDPERRYQNAGELRDDLRRHLAGEPISARRDSQWYILRKALQKHRWAVVSIAVFALLLVGWVAAMAILYSREQSLTAQIQVQSEQTRVERDRALTAESTARARFASVREMATDLLFDAHDRIAALPGATPARAMVAETATRYMADLASDAADDPSLQREVAMGYLRLGDIRGGLGVPNLGDTAGAMVNYEIALDIVQRALAATPNDPALESLLVEIHRRIGNAHSSQGRSDAALDAYGRALALNRTLLARTPDDAALLEQSADIQIQRGNVLATAWKLKAARECYVEALNTFEALYEREPENMAHLRSLAMGQLRIGRLIVVGEERESDAMPFVEKAVAPLRRLAAENPNNAGYRRDLTIALDFKADLFMRDDRPADALPLFQESLDITTRLAELDPENVQGRRDVLIGRNNVGAALLAMGRTDDALTAYEEGLKTAEHVAAADPASAIYRRDVGHGHNNVAKALRAAGRREAAIEALARAIDIYESLAKDDPSNYSVLRDAAIAHSARGDLLAEAGDDAAQDVAKRIDALTRALADYRGYLQALLTLREKNTLAEFEMRFIDVAKQNIADCEKRIAKLRETI